MTSAVVISNIATSSNDWTPASALTGRVMDRASQRGWPVTPADGRRFEDSFCGYKGSGPTSVRIGGIGDLAFTYNELITWIGEGVGALGCEFRSFVDPRQLSLAGGVQSVEPKLAAVQLDVPPFGFEPNRRTERLQLSSWPGLEVLTLAALNPHVVIRMNGEDRPFWDALGLVLGPVDFPRLHTRKYGKVNRVMVDYGWIFQTNLEAVAPRFA